ncbi:ABC transporter substrate-binding protein [Paenibacillus allorhizosphaerae]|uniref:Extracellular solute-binding protein n=1 Tax=Paenibacillus allorhizosphaerae TaxID=2849866 RepID=A0ABM8V9M4_9BACL|nr:extracellular solute-binding protein [Paenibacillus allorhizosphaerae]CAG7613829.1 hypothetical protein PAECIP111802_00017 [Paenibacillus allorhizosphaerae]
MLNGRKVLVPLLAVTMSIASYGCGKSDVKSANGDESKKPVTLSVLKGELSSTPEDFQKFFVEPSKKAFPNIDLQYVELQKGQTYQDLLTAGDFPDLIFTGIRGANTLTDLHIALDLTALIKKYNVDLAKFKPEAMNSIKPYGTNGEIFLLPYTINFYALFYNKDLFDKFGVAYPKDSMTWDDVTELARKMTRSEDGTQYRGVDSGNVTLTARGLSLPFVDTEAKKAVVNNDRWNEVFNTAKAMYTIPGNAPSQEQFGKAVTNFFKEKNIAMFPYYTNAVIERFAAFGGGAQPFQWDVTTYPSFKEAPGKTAELDPSVFLLSKTSKYKDEAFQVISYLATSEEVQTAAAKQGRLPAIQLNGIESFYGEQITVLKDKNVKGMFKSATRELPPATKIDDFARNQLNTVFKNIVYNNLDTVTALRTAEEVINKYIEQTNNQ